MEPITVKLELPREIISTLETPEELLQSRLKELIALELFREERISCGKGAELLGITKSGFIQLLASHGISYFSETPEELAGQILEAENIIGKKAA